MEWAKEPARKRLIENGAISHIKSALHRPDKVESSSQLIIRAIFSFLTHSEQSTANSQQFSFLTHSEHSTANSQQSRTVQPESISDISKVRHAHPSIK